MSSHFEKIEFIAWDGEGQNDKLNPIDEWTPRQHYVLMATSTGEYRYNNTGLSLIERFNFLCEIGAKYPRHVHVFFGASYDFNKILEGLPKNKVEELHHSKFWVRYKDWIIRYRPRKELTIAHIKPGINFNPKIKARQQCDSYIRLWDVIGFFQCPFLEAVKTWLGRDYVDYDLIQTGKFERISFDDDDKEFMLQYCFAEVKALVEIMKKVHLQLCRLGLKITRWDGAGAIAAAVFRIYRLIDSFFTLNRNRGSPTFGKLEKIELDQEIMDACRYAFFGGRIESGYIGRYNDTVYVYDINSAYPYAASLLPNLNHGSWIHHKTLPTYYLRKMNSMSLFRVRYYFHKKRLYYPFPHRTLGGSVIFPEEGERWLMYPEVMAGIESLDELDQLEILEAWEFQPDSNSKSDNTFAIIKEIYAERQKMIEINDPAQIILKLALNSLYGKLCQKLGWNEKEKTSPRFHFLLFGAWITSFIRATIYTAIHEHMDDVIAICTDGIIAKKPLKIVPNTKKDLGQWSFETYRAIVQLQSGVYWMLDEKGIWKEKARGLGRESGDGATEKERIESRNAKIEKRIAQIEDGWISNRNRVYFKVIRFITSKQACAGPKQWPRWGHWYTMHDEATGELGRGLEIRCSGWGKRRLKKKIKLNELTATEASGNIDWKGPGDLGEPYDLPWITGDDLEIDIINDEDLQAVN